MHLLRKRATCHPVWLPPPFLLPSVSLRSSGHSSPSSFWCPQADERMLWWIIYLGFDWRSGASVETQSSLCFSFATQYLLSGASLVAQTVKNLPAMQETWVWSLYQEDPLVKEMATHSSILAWKIPWTEEPGISYRATVYGVTKELDTAEWLNSNKDKVKGKPASKMR